MTKFKQLGTSILYFYLLVFAVGPLSLAANIEENIPLEPLVISVSAMEFTGAVQPNEKGAFDLFIKDLSRLTNTELDYQVSPPARAARIFFNKQSLCLIPSSLHPPYFEGYDVIHSESFSNVTYVAFTLPDQPTINTKAQLAGKVIGVIRDEDTWNYEKRFDLKDVTYIKVSNLDSLIEMLYKKRIDVAINDHSDFMILTEHLNKPTPNFNIDLPMAIDRVVISCHNTPLGQQFINRIDPHIKHILQTDFDKYYQQNTLELD